MNRVGEFMDEDVLLLIGITRVFQRLLARRDISPRGRADIFCARPRTIDVGAREMPRSVVTAGLLCNEGQFAEKIARLANLECDVSS
jgi:hypothetical protein